MMRAVQGYVKGIVQYVGKLFIGVHMQSMSSQCFQNIILKEYSLRSVHISEVNTIN